MLQLRRPNSSEPGRGPNARPVIRVRLTAAGWTALGVAWVALLVAVTFWGSGVVARANYSLLFGVILIGFLTLSWIGARLNVANLRPRREHVDTTTEGRWFDVRYTIENAGRRLPRVALTIIDDLTAVASLDGPRPFVVAVAPRKRVVADVRARLPRRGEWEFSVLRLASRFPFNLHIARATWTRTTDIVAHPRTGILHGFDVDGGGGEVDPSELPARPQRGGIGDYLGVRPHRPGDLLRFVHWKATARTGELIVREHAIPARTAWLLLVDTHLTARDEHSRRDGETAIIYAATLVDAAIAAGHTVGLAAMAGRTLRYVAPVGGRYGRNRLMTELARLHLSPRNAAAVELPAMLGRRRMTDVRLVPVMIGLHSGSPTDGLRLTFAAPPVVATDGRRLRELLRAQNVLQPA
jgi:uncharacterized protein (DUF58 family)